MIVFDQLRISNDGKKMFINLHVNYSEQFDNIMLDSITVITADKAYETDPKIPTEDYIYKKVYTEDMQVANITLDKAALDEAFNNWNGTEPINPSKPHAKLSFDKRDFNDGLFLVYVKVKGSVAANTPCGLDEEITLGMTFNESLLYQRAMGFTKELVDHCKIPVGFTDFILLWNAFKASLETEHYIPAIKYFNMLFGLNNAHSPYNKSYTPTKPCGCHG